jgi:guanine deaminase
MNRAIELSAISTGGPFGAVIVDREGNIIGEGHNEVTVNNDPTAHAEVVAIRRACANSNNFSLEGCTIYTSCEPCPMCLAACYWARLDKIYYANTRQDAADISFDDRYIYEEIKKDNSERALPIIQIEDNDSKAMAKKIFADWYNNSKNIRY